MLALEPGNRCHDRAGMWPRALELRIRPKRPRRTGPSLKPSREFSEHVQKQIQPFRPSAIIQNGNDRMSKILSDP
jgi:hypothetical protein